LENLQKSRSYTRVFSRSIVAIGLAHFTTHLLEFALPPLYPLVMEEFSLSYSDIGVVSSAVVITMFIFQTPVGYLSDKKGRKFLLLSFLGILIGSTFLTGISKTFVHLLIFQICVGIGASAYHSAGMALASDIAPGKKIGRFMAIQGFGGTLGVAAAPFAVSFLGALLGWRDAVKGIAVAALPLLVCVWWFLRTTGEGRQPTEKDTIVLSRTVIVFILLGFILQGFVFRGIISFFPTYMVDIHGSSLKLAGGLTSLLFLGGAVAELVGGEWADRTEKLNVVVISYGLRCLLLYLINTVYHEPALVASIFAFGFVQGLSIPAMVSLIREMSPPGSAGKSYGAVFSISTLTGFFSPLVVGYVADLYDLGFSFSILTVCLFFGFVFSAAARYFRFR
jgi:FSR family fosmidomycin resistance protein-like MFS transporter